MRKLYTQYTNSELNTPFMVTFEGNQVQACANDGDTITISSTEYVRVTDGSGHDVKAVIPNSGDETPHKLLVRLGDENSHDLCYIEDDETVSSTSIQVTDIQPVPQETVIEYTSTTGTDYTTNYGEQGEIPANAYLTFDLVNRPTAATRIEDYNVDCGFMIGTETGRYSPYIVHAEGLDYVSSIGHLPIESGIPKDTIGEIGQLAVTDNTYVQECIKKVTLNADSSCEIEVENTSTGATRTINVASADNHIDFSEVKSRINAAEANVDALRHFGYYLAFVFVDSHQQTHDNAPVVKLHIPSA